MTSLTKNNKTYDIQARALEVIYPNHINSDLILNHIRKATYGLYKAFIKWHKGDKENLENHTHVALILRDKPKLNISSNYHKKYFSVQVGEVGENLIVPTLVKPLGKGNSSPLKKLKIYVDYLVDGHDNGKYTDSYNYKYDHELLSTKSVVGRAILLMSRGKTFEEIFIDASWDVKADLTQNEKQINATWARYNSICNKPLPKELKPWQTQVIQELKNQSDRKIKWIYDKKGNEGKTFLCKELAVHHDTAVFNNAGKKDIAYAYNYQKNVAFNLTRTTAGRVNYEAMEQLLDGLMFSGKYESSTKVFEPPTMVVFSNFLPDYTAMSIDRWDIQTLKRGRLSVTLPSSQENGFYSDASELDSFD